MVARGIHRDLILQLPLRRHPMTTTDRNSGRALTRTKSEERVDVAKMKEHLSQVSGVAVHDIGHFRKPLPIEIMFTQAIKLGVKKFGLEVGGKLPTLADLLMEKYDLSITMRKYNPRVRKTEKTPVFVRSEIIEQMAALYKDKVTDARGDNIVYTICIPLYNHEVSPARGPIEEAVAKLHTAVKGAKPITCEIQWVGMTDRELEQEPLEPKPTAETPAETPAA